MKNSVQQGKITFCCFSICIYELRYCPTPLPGDYVFALSVAVSVPKISLQDKPILEQPFHVLCQSAVGSFPITYILYSNATKLKETVVHLPNQTALFTVVIYNAKELGSYKCEARNGGKRMQSEELVISAIGRKALNTFISSK